MHYPLSLLFAFALCQEAAAQVVLRVSNPTALQRQELVSWPLATLRERLGLASDEPIEIVGPDGQVAQSQQSYDGHLLFDASVRPHSSATYTVCRPTAVTLDARATACMSLLDGTQCVALDEPQDRVWASGRLYPDRLDDIAWENDRGAYRIYGPAFEQSGAVGYGPDVWTKLTPDPDIDLRFRQDIDVKPAQHALESAGYQELADRLVRRNTFHKDHGTGNDAYSVGPTLGCGGSALVVGDSICYPSCWRDYEILDNGPLRFTVRLRYADVEVAGRRYASYRQYSLDKGSNFNRVEVWYESADDQPAASHVLDLCAGFPLHAPGEATLSMGDGFMEYADPTDDLAANSCELYIGCLFPHDDVETTVSHGHALALRPLPIGEHMVYYAGSAWSKADVRNQLEWRLRIATTLAALRAPLTVEWEK